MTEFKNISIRRKLVIIQVATAFFAVLFCCAIFVYSNIKVFKTNSVASKNSIAEIVGINAASTLEFMDHDAARQMLQKLQSNPSILNAVILDKKGKVFARYDKPGEESFSIAAPDEEVAKEQNNFSPRFTVSYKVTGKEFLGTVILRAEINEFNDIILSYLEIALVILLASLLAAFIISNILQRSITNRLLSLVNKTKEVTETGNYSVRVSTEGQDEIGTLSGAFNNMLSQIETQNLEILSLNQNLEQKISERTSQLEEANKELEAFSYSVSHDLRTPLRAIDGYGRWLEDKYTDVLDSEGRRLLGQMKTNAVRMGVLIDDLLSFARMGRKEVSKTMVDMTELTRSALIELSRSMEIKAEVKIEQLHPVMADYSLMEHVMTNLLSNAIKYSSLKDKPVVIVRSEKKKGEIVYSVEDNGAGFDMKYADKLFGVFQRLHKSQEFSGTGVGLAIVHRIITKHGGRVWAEGKVGEGAKFYFSLPDTK